MKLKFVINRWANFYFFVQNLSEWHFSCRKNYNTLWQKQFGELTNKEKRPLETFKKIRLNYKKSKSCFEIAFFTKQNPWIFLKSNLPPREYKTIKKVFENLEIKFTKLYCSDLPTLKKWQILLNKKGNDQKINQKIIQVLDGLYGTNIRNKNITIKIYLLFSSPNNSGGGANINQKSISLEISRLPLDMIYHVFGIIWHEIIHLSFQNQVFFPLLLNNISEQNNANLINEITTAALFPKGLLSKKFFNNQLINNLHPFLTPEKTCIIFRLLKNYLHNLKPLDICYINRIKNILGSPKL